MQVFFGRLARQEVRLPSLIASAGAHVGTVRPMRSPFVHRDRRLQRELRGLAEERLELDQRALRDELVAEALGRA